MGSVPDNLESLHSEEERIRSESIETIERISHVKDHLFVIHASMNVIFAIVQGHKHRNNDEKTIQYLGLRIFNSCASVLKLGLSGYYQSAFALVRDIYETVLLLDYFRSHRDQISVWETSDKKRRIKEFSPAIIRNALDKRDGKSSRRRKEIYDKLSEYASHATAPGFRLVAPEGLGKIGPFMSDKYLRALIEEAVKFAAQGGTVFISFFKDVDEELLLEKAHFLDQVDKWQRYYLRGISKNAT
jgi:hypothetical protein